MKKWIILLLVVGAVVLGWWWMRTYYRYPLVWKQPKFGTVTRGDIRVPIAASGLIEPHQRIDVKSKASGEVIEILVTEGRFVRRGDTLLRLKPDDEERTRDRARATLDRARALLEQARVAEKKAVQNVAIAEARVQELEEQSKRTDFELKKVRALEGGPGRANDQEKNDAEVAHNMVLAQLKSARAQLETARLNVEDATHAIVVYEADVSAAEKQLADAEERLRETTILAPRDALVTHVRVREGMLVQSGINSFTGGDVVMTLADISKKKVVARVDEADYGRVLDISPATALPEMTGLREAVAADAAALERRGGRVTLYVDAFPEEKFEGVIERVEPQGKQNPGAAIIQFDVHVAITDERAYKLPLGAQAQVEFTVESAIDVLRIPTEAAMTFQDERGVWIKTPPKPGSTQPFDKKFIRCRFGISDGEFTHVIEVLEGHELKEGQEVFTKLPQEEEEEED